MNTTKTTISREQADEIARNAATDDLGAMEDFEDGKDVFMYFFEFGQIHVAKDDGSVLASSYED